MGQNNWGGIGGGMIDMTPDEEYDLWLDWRF